jgi:hypothetical protein
VIGDKVVIDDGQFYPSTFTSTKLSKSKQGMGPPRRKDMRCHTYHLSSVFWKMYKFNKNLKEALCLIFFSCFLFMSGNLNSMNGFSLHMILNVYVKGR